MTTRGLVVTAALLAGGLAGLTTLWEKTQSVDPVVTARYEGDLRELQRLDRTLNQDVLRARFQLINTYDPLVASRNRIDTLRGRLEATPGYLAPAAADGLRAEVRDYEAQLVGKTAEIETFKSRNSVLKNSLRYVPTMAGEVAARLDADAPATGLGPDVRATLSDVLVYNLTSDEGLAPKIQARVADLRARSTALPAPDRRQLGLLLAHFDKIAETKPLVDASVRAIFDVPVVAHEESVAGAFRAGVATAEAEADRYRTALYLASIGMAGLVIFAFQRLRRALSALAEANATLEQKVADRTAALDGRNHAMRLVLDNVEQGFVVVGADGRLATERSAALDRWVTPETVGATPTVWAWVGSVDARAGQWLELGWTDLCAEELPFEILVDQLPKRISRGDLHLGLELRPLRDGAGVLTSILLVVSDITERVARERAEAEGRDLLRVIEHLLADRSGFLEFFEEGRRIVELASSPSTPRAEVFRAVHTLKGNAGLFGISTVAAVCHELESALADGEDAVSADQLRALQDRWSSFAQKIAPLLGEGQERRVEITTSELAALRRRVQSGATPKEIDRVLGRLTDEPVAQRFERFAQQAQALGERLGKGEVRVTVEAGDVRLPRERYAGFWGAFVHVLRNAIDHGLEADGAVREAAGKPPTGELRLVAREADGVAMIELRDDGRGVDWEAIRARAMERAMPCRNHADLVNALFADGLSTRDEVSDVSGRGVGMGAVRRAVEELGGTIEITSEPGRGTAVRFRFPREAVRLAA